MRSECFIVRLIVWAVFLCSAAGIFGQTSAFTYQGKLTDAEYQEFKSAMDVVLRRAVAAG